MTKRLLRASAVILPVLAAGPAFAHGGHAEGLAAGFTHPLLGIDHLVAMLAIGLWAAQSGMARAWALRPDVLLLDEPTSSLDPHAKREVELLMADLAASHGQAGPGHPVTMVFSSHNLGQVKRLASRVIYLEHGAVLADLPVHDFFNGPLPDAARLFVKGEMV